MSIAAELLLKDVKGKRQVETGKILKKKLKMSGNYSWQCRRNDDENSLDPIQLHDNGEWEGWWISQLCTWKFW